MKPIIKTARNLLNRNASDLLLVGGVACILGGGILAIRQTPKAVQLMENKKDKPTIDKIKTVAPLYIPPLLLTGVGIAQIVCSRNITNNKIAAMATAYTVSETAFKTYREKVKDIVEPDKYEEIKREVADEQLRRDPIGNKEIIMTTRGNVLMYDNMSGRYLKSTMDDVDRAVNILNKRMMSDMTVLLNDFYTEIGLDVIKLGCEVGWDIEKDSIDVRYTSTIADNGEPCLVMDYEVVVLR
jgi:hypothetical protein